MAVNSRINLRHFGFWIFAICRDLQQNLGLQGSNLFAPHGHVAQCLCAIENS